MNLICGIRCEILTVLLYRNWIKWRLFFISKFILNLVSVYWVTHKCESALKRETLNSPNQVEWTFRISMHSICFKFNNNIKWNYKTKSWKKQNEKADHVTFYSLVISKQILLRKLKLEYFQQSTNNIIIQAIIRKKLIFVWVWEFFYFIVQ